MTSRARLPASFRLVQQAVLTAARSQQAWDLCSSTGLTRPSWQGAVWGGASPAAFSVLCCAATATATSAAASALRSSGASQQQQQHHHHHHHHHHNAAAIVRRFSSSTSSSSSAAAKQASSSTAAAAAAAAPGKGFVQGGYKVEDFPPNRIRNFSIVVSARGCDADRPSLLAQFNVACPVFW